MTTVVSLRLGVALAGAALVALTSCSGPVPVPADEQPAPSDTAPTSAPAAPGSQPSSGLQTSAPPRRTTAPASVPATPATQEIVATRKGSLPRRYGGTAEVTAQISAVRRAGRLAVVNIALDTPESYTTFKLGGAFSDNDPQTSAVDPEAADGIKLIDSTTGNIHLAATLPSGEWLCSPSTHVDPMDAYNISVTFAAPPPEVTTVDLIIPVFGTVSDVPIR